ncbi:hypothetical protein [Nitratireductor sp. ZSWI3]|uniref:hypothetical protein n=1 Tax=Nitratireductor sp. ZSWI3 TaxID=2966359 RepID=UPI00214F8836|nr:hypothetical protein [Nitratireductor sp. ZSWI3]MCR4265530.1 hypothetical protein [Nitratireductor sp. ZSWI3]
MLMKLDTSWLLFGIAAVTMLAYLLSLGLDAVMREDGFGALGNAGIITVAFFATIYLANDHGIRFASLTEAAFAGMSGSFSALLILTFAKAILKRVI